MNDEHKKHLWIMDITQVLRKTEISFVDNAQILTQRQCDTAFCQNERKGSLWGNYPRVQTYQRSKWHGKHFKRFVSSYRPPQLVTVVNDIDLKIKAKSNIILIPNNNKSKVVTMDFLLCWYSFEEQWSYLHEWQTVSSMKSVRLELMTQL